MKIFLKYIVTGQRVGMSLFDGAIRSVIRRGIFCVFIPFGCLPPSASKRVKTSKDSASSYTPLKTAPECLTGTSRLADQLRYINNNRGISIIGTVFTLIILGVMGAALVSIVATDQESRMRSIFRERSFYAVQAGLEYALREIKEGGYPIVTSKPLGDGSFTSSIVAANREITVIGASSDSSRTNSITTSLLAKDCLTINTAGASAGGSGNEQLRGVSLSRSCLNAVRISSMVVTWTPDQLERVKKISIGGTLIYNDINGTGSSVTINTDDYRVTTPVAIDYIEFSSAVSGKSITLTLNFTDSSSVISSTIVL